jgi:hypothetical protein
VQQGFAESLLNVASHLASAVSLYDSSISLMVDLPDGGGATLRGM